MRIKPYIIFIFILSIIPNLFARDTTLVSSGIKVSARVSTKEIPLNRLLKFTIQVEWFGDLNRYKISEVENPVVRNFEILSNSNADRREHVNGQLKAIKTFEFDLIPRELGMGYIEGVIVKYIDTASGDGKHLITNRLEVKVIDPLPEPGSKTWLIKWIILGLVIVSLSVVLILWRQQRIAEKKRKAEEAAIVPIEQEFLNQLKEAIPLGSPDLNIKNAYSSISNLLRKYLAEKYSFGASNALIEDILSVLKHNSLSDRHISNIEEILKSCDVIKFSGGAGDKAELERLYTLVENILNENLKHT